MLLRNDFASVVEEVFTVEPLILVLRMVEQDVEVVVA